MDRNTAVIVSLIGQTDIKKRPDLLQQSKSAFIDYLAAALAAGREPKVKNTAVYLSLSQAYTPFLGQPYQASASAAAFFNGFCSHYLDYDDAQANIAGHFSTVLFSTLLAVADMKTSILDFFTAYTAGAELEGILGSYVNPAHKQQGWHSTGTIGPIGAAAAIAKLKNLGQNQTAQLLSLGATQSAGMGFEAGSDAKPMHAGFAARNAVFAYELLTKAGLSANINPFNNDTGWLRTISGEKIDIENFKKKWLQPGQIILPGLWMKLHSYCSAGICGAAGCQQIYEEGWPLEKLKEVKFHFPLGADKALRYKNPRTGQEGRFSIEYVAWQILTNGKVNDKYFKLAAVPEEFVQSLPKFERCYDMGVVEKSVRLTKVTAVTTAGRIVQADIRNPLGSPQRPFSRAQLKIKLTQAIGSVQAEAIFKAAHKWPAGTLADIWEIMYPS